MKILCNPLEIAYKYQHPLHGKFAYKEAADPTLVRFGGKYLLFTSKCGGFYYSDDLFMWQFHEDRTLEIHGYAPDVSVCGEWLYFCASAYSKKCKILRTKDPFKGFELVNTPFPFWDPHLYFEGERAYLYWGCSSKEPIHAVEMDAEKMTPKGARVDIVAADPANHGMDDKSPYADEKRSLWQRYISLFTGSGTFIEGAYLNKIGGRYYFQYASPGTEYPTYGDAVLVGDSPLGPFTWQKHNPYSLIPGGFTQGAGHGSTFEDEFGNLWHASTICVGVNHNFERRLGLWPAGVDENGILFCNQYFADYPKEIPNGKFESMSIKPAFMLLSYQKKVTASSSMGEMPPQNAVDESMKTMWQAVSGDKGEWLCVDLGSEKDVRAVQVNFGDFKTPKKKAPRREYGGTLTQERYIDEEQPDYCYVLEVSADKQIWETFGGGSTKLPHKLWEGKARARYVRITFVSAPFGQKFTLCGLRVFGFGNGQKCGRTCGISAQRTSATRAKFSWAAVEGAVGYCLRLGIASDKLYTSVLLYGQNNYAATFLNAETKDYYYAVDAFNEQGITEGEVYRIGEVNRVCD